MDKRDGHLVIIGGGEDRIYGKEILGRFVELAGGLESTIVLITAASGLSEHMWEVYRQAFGELGVIDLSHLAIDSRVDANSERAVRLLAGADGIFMTGGDQKRLLALIGGTKVDRALHAAYKERGACIGGTSAGASAMSGHMLASGAAVAQPEKGAVSMAAGLGLLQHVLIDQHFSERHRLGRLLTAIAQNPPALFLREICGNHLHHRAQIRVHFTRRGPAARCCQFGHRRRRNRLRHRQSPARRENRLHRLDDRW